jgi:hypothetical protein
MFHATKDFSKTNGDMAQIPIHTFPVSSLALPADGNVNASTVLPTKRRSQT